MQAPNSAPDFIFLGSHARTSSHDIGAGSMIEGRRSGGLDSRTPSPRNPRPSPLCPRRGLTLIEMLVSLACVILLMLAYTQLFAEAGARINDARAAIDLTNRLRSAVQHLRNEFAGVTAEMLPWQRPESGAGTFEIIEGPLSDATYDVSLVHRNNGIVTDDPGTTDYDERLFPFGDTDDVLMFTVRSKGAPFTGKFDGATVQSETALVVWFLRPTLNINPADPTTADLAITPQTYSLYQRAFLVMPTMNGNPVRIAKSSIGDLNTDGVRDIADFWCAYDISVHDDGTSYVANTLADLTKRENRFAHDPTTFPHLIDPRQIVPFGGTFASGSYLLKTSHPRYGEDVVLTNVLAFDVQVWDPNAPLKFDAANNNALGPGDPGYSLLSSKPTGTFGAYVDLSWGQNVPWFPIMSFQTIGHPLSRLTAAGTYPANLDYRKTWLFFAPGNSNYFQPATYDLWSFHYEHDGINQDWKNVSGTIVDDLTDEGTDGFDNPYNNSAGTDQTQNLTASTSYVGGVDDPTERETSPPYPVPLRGIKVRIRVYEPDTRQIREVSVEHSFVPE